MQDWQQAGMFEDEVPEASGKTLQGLAFSRQRRLDILRMFRGELPMSIMAAQKEAREDDPDASGSYARASNVTNDGSQLAKVFDVSGQSVRSGALSMFPQNIGRAITLLYSQPGHLVLDPFAGHNSRMTLCVKEGRSYQGYDISTKFMTFNHEQAATLRGVRPDVKILLHLQDSRQMIYTPGSTADFTITSPPYYDLEDYGDEPEQLGAARTYRGFLDGLTLVAAENYRGLKPGSFAVWFVNDFRRKGVFTPFHIDTANMMRRVGFQLWDTMIVDLGYPIRAAFAAQIGDSQILPKCHEYGLVFRKPGY